MILCAAGDIHGALRRLYDDVFAFEHHLGVRFDHVLQVGDFGVLPDPLQVDRATMEHGGPGDFPAWNAAQRAVPRTTLFIKGNHEDFEWLDAHPTGEVLIGLRYLRSGSVQEIHEGDERVRVAGLGGCYGPSNYERRSGDLRGSARRHYTRDEIERLKTAGPVDILLTHDAPGGVAFSTHRRGPYVSTAAGLDELVRRVRPRVSFFGHHHARIEAEVHGVPCIGLNYVGRPGNMVALEVLTGSHRILGRWPLAAPATPPVKPN